jgi:imidazolonepropionase-like amidohydrolase
MSPVNLFLKNQTHPSSLAYRRIKAGWLIDGSGGFVLKDVVVEFKGEILSVIRQEEISHINSEPFLDYSDCTLIPGMFDAHVHLFMPGSENVELRKRSLSASFNEASVMIRNHLNKHLSSGIVGVRDGGDNGGFALRFKNEQIRDMHLPIILQAAGKAWHKAGRYGSLIGRPPGENETLGEAILRETSGADHVKIINSGINSLIRYAKETPPQFHPEELEKGVKAAAKLGLPVMVHANGKIPTEIAVSSGCQSIEHGFFMGKENLKKIRDRNQIWIPTACTMKAFSMLYTGKSKDVSERTLEDQLNQIRYAGEIGVRVAAGTDSGSMGVHHGASIKDELGLFMDAGYSVQKAVECATRNGASLLGLSGMGVIAPGKSATFTAVKGSPADFPLSLNRICGLYVNGSPILEISFSGQDKVL